MGLLWKLHKIDLIDCLYRFAPHGSILSVKVLQEEHVQGKSRCRGVGFVNYAEAQGALKAINNVNGMKIADKHLHVSLQANRAGFWYWLHFWLSKNSTTISPCREWYILVEWVHLIRTGIIRASIPTLHAYAKSLSSCRCFLLSGLLLFYLSSSYYSITARSNTLC